MASVKLEIRSAKQAEEYKELTKYRGSTVLIQIKSL